jgi:hypothetical protein
MTPRYVRAWINLMQATACGARVDRDYYER